MGKKPSWPAVMMTTLTLWIDRRGVRSRRRVVGVSALLIVFLAVALVVVLIVRPGPTPAAAQPDPPATKSAKTHQDPAKLAAAALLRGEAAAWIVRQVSPAVIVSCDPAMCSALQAQGVPSSQLSVLMLAATDPLASEVVVATPAIRSQFGTRLSTVYAPELIASFGSGATRIDIRAIAPDGAAAFESALAADQAARITAGQQLLRNKRITVSKAARTALDQGAVDPRLLVTLAGLAAQQRVSVVTFGDPSPGAPGVPLRSVQVRAVNGADQRGMLSFLHAQRAPYLPALIQTAGADHFRIEIDYDAPGPLGMGGEQ